MGLREVKNILNGMDKTEIIKLISEMYKKLPTAKDYLDIYVTGDIKGLTEKYKKQIEKYIYPTGNNIVLRDSEARKIIRTVRKMKEIQLNVELELHYVSCCLDIITDFGYWDENYYLSIEKMYNNAVCGILELGIEGQYEERLEHLSARASEFEIQLYK